MFGNGDYPGMQVERLLTLSIAPLCSPALRDGTNGRHPLRMPEDLRGCTLLHDERGMLYEGRSFCDAWFDVAGLSGIDANQAPHFSHSMLALEAAMAGQGVVASTIELAAGALERGHLVMPFPNVVQLTSSYYLVSNKSSSKREATCSVLGCTSPCWSPRFNTTWYGCSG
jgi:LysR family glycine cleavage system transcriptional activator